MIKLTRRYRVSPNLWGLRETDAGKSFISLLESRMHLIDARTVREQGVSSNPGPRVSASKQIMKARVSCESVFLDKFLQQRISELCSELNIDGLRGDIVVTRAAKALAAFNGSYEVQIPDIAMVVTLCLRHRLRKGASMCHSLF